jgi:CSLREA domain-containing protein
MGHQRNARTADALHRALRIEQLEDRRLLTITVNTLVDENDGIGVGGISLRDAIAAAPSGETIQFDPALTSGGPAKINLTHGELVIARNLTINGPGANLLTIDASASDPTPFTNNGDGSRVFKIDDGNFATLKTVSISGLKLTGGDTSAQGGGGGLLSLERLTLSHSTVTGNSSRAEQFGGGGGISSRYGNLTVVNCIVSNNVDQTYGGGGIASRANSQLTLTSSTVSTNQAQNLLNLSDRGVGGGVWGENLTISGSTITGNAANEVGGGIFVIRNGVLTLTNSQVTGNTAASSGGGVYGSYASLTIEGSTISGNTSSFGDGGGIYGRRLTKLALTSSTVNDNKAGGRGGGFLSYHGYNTTVTSSVISGNQAAIGGGIASRFSDVLTIVNSSITHNAANGSYAGGGGVWKEGGQLTVTGSHFHGNTARESGGGVYARYSNASFSDCTISGNTAKNGGGLYTKDGALTIAGCTISGNTAHVIGGGIQFLGRPGAAVAVRHSTVTNNRAEAFGGGVFFAGGPLSLSHSIVAANKSTSGLGPDLASLYGEVLSASYSLVGSNAGNPLLEAPIGSPDAGGNLVGGAGFGVIDPLLAPLNYNGGPTLPDGSLLQTHALLAGSPAIDAGDPALAAGVGGVPQFDERGAGFSRVLDGDHVSGPRIDMGALEQRSLSLTVDTLADEDDGDAASGDFSLREAIAATNANFGGNDKILFAPTLALGTIVLTQGELQIAEGVTIVGLGRELLTVSAAGNDLTPALANGDGSRVFNINNVRPGTPASISGMTLTGGDAQASGGAVYCRENLAMDDVTITDNYSAFSGGGIFSRGQLTLTNSTISGNGASRGGGVYSSGAPGSPGKVTVTKSTINGNESLGFGGGLMVGNGSTTITDSAISGNIAGAFGGGVYSGYGTLNVVSSVISENSAGQGAGGIASFGDLAVASSTISDNTSGGDGGGISILSHILTLSDSTISGNSAVGGGGGIWGRYAYVTATSSTISGNSAILGGGILLKDGGKVLLQFTTVTNNEAQDGAGSGVAVEGFGIYQQIRARSSIISGNVNSDVDLLVETAVVESLGYNLIGGGNASSAFNQPGDHTGVANPMLGPLADNGGPTKTHALLSGSPAIDTGDPAAVADTSGVPELDQRGAPFGRLVGERIDIGAVEYQPIAPSGDFDGDGATDGFDFLTWQRGFGLLAPVGDHASGDADYDHDVDGADLGVWRSAVGASVAATIAEQLVAACAANEQLITGGDGSGSAAVAAIVSESLTPWTYRAPSRSSLQPSTEQLTAAQGYVETHRRLPLTSIESTAHCGPVVKRWARQPLADADRKWREEIDSVFADRDLNYDNESPWISHH